MAIRLPYLHLTFTDSKGQDQVYAHFDSEYLEYGGRYVVKITIAVKQQVMDGLSIGKFSFDRDVL